MSDSVRPDRRQPTRLPRPWDSPGKNTGVGCHFLLQYRKVKSESEVFQSCPTLRNPMDCSLPGSSAYGIFQARVLEWVAIAFSKIPSREVAQSVRLFVTPWTVPYHAPPSVGILQARILEWVAISFSKIPSRWEKLTRVWVCRPPES